MCQSMIPYLYSENSLLSMLQKTISYFRQTGTIRDLQNASALEEYKDIRLNTSLLEEIKSLTLDLPNLLTNKFPETNYILEFRIKSLISLEEKILRNIFLNLSVDIKDTLGIRVILCEEPTLNGILHTFEIIFDILEFILSKGYILCTADQPIDIQNFDFNRFPSIVVPTIKDLMSLTRYQTYQYGLKNYILTPKEDGYQSVHAVFKSRHGKTFELQIRTLFMHNTLHHASYKDSKYKNIQLQVDPYRIHTPNFFINQEKEIIDYDGILLPIHKVILDNL